MKVILAQTEITKYINESTYNINSSAEYNEWTDGNYKKHHDIVRERVEGSFTVALGSFRDFSTEDFNELVESATTSGVTTIGVWVLNKSEFKAINCFLTTKVKKHRKLSDGSYIDIVEVNVEEC